MVHSKCVQSTMYERTSIMQTQPKGDLLPEAILIVANIVITNLVRSCEKFDAHTHYHCQVININRYYQGFLIVAMAIILVDSTEVVRWSTIQRYIFIA